MNKKILILQFILLLISFIVCTNKAEAARFYFEPQETAIGPDQEFTLYINMDADNSINTLSIAISFPPDVEMVDYSDGNSVINLWVDKPVWNSQNRTFSFSGIIPGGFTGKNAKLISLNIKTKKTDGELLFSFDTAETRAYLNTGEGKEDIVTLNGLNLPVIKEKENASLKIIDQEPPETFLPEISRDQNIFQNQWIAVFTTQDKASGIKKYEINEYRPFLIYKVLPILLKNNWKEASSPYLLSDQDLKSYVRVRAIDKKGNERIITLSPRFPLLWYEDYSIFGIILLIAGLVAIALKKKIIWIRRKSKK